MSRLIPLILLAALAAGCSVGDDSQFVGGDGSTRPPPPVPNPTLGTMGYDIKQLKFQWAPVTGATRYRLFESPDGPDGEDSGYSQIGPVFDADELKYDHEIFVPSRRYAAYILQSCELVGNEEDCTDSSPTFVGPLATSSIYLPNAIGYFKATNTGENDHFGHSVALSADGTTLAVGAPLEASAATGACDPATDECEDAQSNNTAIRAGAVYVYVRTVQGWVPQAYVKAPNAGRGDQFGFSVALSGDGSVLAIGAPSEGSAAAVVCEPGESACAAAMADNSICALGALNCTGGTGAGAAYVFVRDAEGGWAPRAYVKAPNTRPGDQFGHAVVLSQDGTTLLIGAPHSKDEQEQEVGAVHAYAFDEGWALRQTVFGGSNRFGYSLAADAEADVFAVGAPGTCSTTAGSCNGAVYLYRRTDPEGGWTPTPYFAFPGLGTASPGGSAGCSTIINSTPGSCFGYAVALTADGRGLAVGAPTEASNATGINNEANNSLAPGSGAVYVFSCCDGEGAWLPTATYIKAAPPVFSPGTTGSRFGSAVAFSGDGATLAVGAYRDATLTMGIDGPAPGEAADETSRLDSGAGYVFVHGAEGWRQSAFVKARTTGGSDNLGWSVAMSADGATMALGAHLESSDATGVGGTATEASITQAGAVYLY